jgi:hypothetical protein
MLDAQTRPQSAALSPAEQDNAWHLIPPRPHGGAQHHRNNFSGRNTPPTVSHNLLKK